MSQTILYVSGDKGVAVLRKHGADWKLQAHGLQDWAVPKIGAHRSKPERIFAGTRGDGVWVSEDFGDKWTKPCYGKRGPGKVRCVSVHPRDPDILYAGGEPIDIFMSNDAAKSWTRLDAARDTPGIAECGYPLANVEPHVRDIVFDPANPNILYAALQVGFILKSTDGGESWRLLDKGLDADVHAIVVDPQNTRRLFIASGGDSYRAGQAAGRSLYKSNDGGESWSPTAMNFNEEYSVPLVMHPKDPKILYTALAHGSPGSWRRPTGAESYLLKTADGGENWQKLDGGPNEGGRNFTETLVIDEESPNQMYAGTRSGDIYASDDSGENWRKLDIKVPSISDMKCVHV
jgi:photosystem II stability/assembly factor-like uncharacterized protein